MAQATYTPYSFTTFAGLADIPDRANWTGNTAQLYNPMGVVVDSAGCIYVADSGNAVIRKIGPDGVITTVAGLAGQSGSADAIGIAARFKTICGMAVDSAGNIYVADSGNNAIRKVTSTGCVTTLAGGGSFGNGDGIGTAARFYGPMGVGLDRAGNIYVADSGNNAIRKVTPAGVVTTFAGLSGSWNGGSADGRGAAARFNQPRGVVVDGSGSVYVADEFNNTIRKVTPDGMVTTLAGLAGSFGGWDGMGADARFNEPSGVAVDSAGNIYVADYGNCAIRKVTPSGKVTTVAGMPGQPGKADGTGWDGDESVARFNWPFGVAVDSAGNLYVADTLNNAVRKVTSGNVVTTLPSRQVNFRSPDGIGSDARFSYPTGLASDGVGNLYVADEFNNAIRKVTPTGVVTTLAGLAQADPTGPPDANRGSADGTGSAARFDAPSGVAVDKAGSVYVADYGNHTIRKVTPSGAVTTLAGVAGSRAGLDGTGSAARFNSPFGLALDDAGNVYVADSGNNAIRKVTTGGVVTTLAGLLGGWNSGSTDGIAGAARFNFPTGLAVDGAGNIYVADSDNHTIRKVTVAGVVSTLAGRPLNSGNADGTGMEARFNNPSGVAVDSTGNIYVVDSANNTIRRLTPAGVVTTLAGLAGTPGSMDGFGSAVRFSGPHGVAVDGAGNLCVADTLNNTIRKGSVGQSPIAISISGPAFSPCGGHFGFMLRGPPGWSIVIEASTDLVNWLPIWTNTIASDLSFSDPHGEPYSNLFYRARVP